MKISVILPTYNEEECIEDTITDICEELKKESIDHEIIVVDNGTDKTSEKASNLAKNYSVRVLSKSNPPTFSGAIKKGIDHSIGDAIVIVMADASDNPKDITKYYKKLEEGYDCVLGSRFIKGSKIENYPKLKMLANRATNNLIRALFFIRHNDVTNAFKAYKKTVIQDLAPINARDFNISVELALKAITRGYSYATIPISWRGREKGVAKMNVKKMTRKYLFTILHVLLEKILLKDETMQKTKKILFFCYNGKETPSSRVRCYEFANMLRNNGANARVISCKDDLKAEYDGADSYKMNNWQRTKVLLRAIKTLAKENKRTPIYIQKTGFHILAPLLIHYIKGNKLIIDYDDYEYDEKSKLSKLFFHKAVKNAELCVAASRQLEQFLKKFHNKVYYIPTGVDLHNFSMNTTKNKDNNEPIKIYWGGIIGTDAMLETLKKLVNGFNTIKQNAILQLGGFGERYENLKEHCKQKKADNIEFIGWDRTKLLQLMNNVDIGLMPLFQNSVYNQAKSPTKLFEYLAKGMITISSSVGEMNQIIQDGVNGFLAKDENEFIEKLNYAIKNIDDLEQMKLSARKTAEKYSLQTLGKELFEAVHTNFFD